MIRRFSAIAVVLMLSACSSVIGSATQDITIETPGTGDAICTLDRPGYASRVWAPKTVRITKSSDPMEITCRAPGNREKKIVVEPELATSFMLNAFNGVIPGAVVDYSTSAMYQYPEKIVVDFTGMLPQKMPVPDYQQVLDQNPDVFDMEEWRPGAAALQRDRNYAAPELRPRRSEQETFSDGGGSQVSVEDAETPAPPQKQQAVPQPAAPPVAIQPGSSSTADQLTRKMNPQVFGTGASGPAGIHPVQ